MNKDKIYPEERLIKIMGILKRDSTADVEKLSELFGVIGATIRTDLRELDRRGLIARTHGGAMLKGIFDGNLKADRAPYL